jgi:hypothetical protein
MTALQKLIKSATTFATSFLPTTQGALQRAERDALRWFTAHGCLVPDIDEYGSRRILFVLPITVEQELQDHIEELIEIFETEFEDWRRILA